MTESSSKDSRLKAMLIPKPQPGSQYTLVTMIHPRTRAPTRFLRTGNVMSSIYELTSITGKRRIHIPGEPRIADLASEKAKSLLIETEMEKSTESNDNGIDMSQGTENNENTSYYLSDPSITICTPVSPVFFILDTLFKARSQFLQPDVIYEMLETATLQHSPSANTLDYITFKKAAFSICIPMTKEDPGSESVFSEALNQLSDNNLYKLSPSLMVKHFEKIVHRIIDAGLPKEIYKRMVEGPILPPYSTENEEGKADPAMIELATQRAAMHLVCSYIPPEISNIYLATKKEAFAKLDAHIADISRQKQIAIANQVALATTGLSDGQARNVITKKRGPDSSVANSNKKKQATTETRSRATNTLAKVDKSGTRSLSSFFKPVAKK